ncbi:MAG: nucleotidyltransferase domain-containing protein, partial [Thermomicrobiales bacterium]
MDPNQIATRTGHQDIDEILTRLAGGLVESLADRLAGFYLTGSLTYGGFDRGSSDIDYLVVLNEPLPGPQRAALVALHDDVGMSFPEWRERIEGSYITRDMLPNTMPLPQGRPYVNQGIFWDPDPPYGNEWLLNLHVLRECGIALIGPDLLELIGPIAIEDVREASKRDLFEEWLPKANDS